MILSRNIIRKRERKRPISVVLESQFYALWNSRKLYLASKIMIFVYRLSLGVVVML